MDWIKIPPFVHEPAHVGISALESDPRQIPSQSVRGQDDRGPRRRRLGSSEVLPREAVNRRMFPYVDACANRGFSVYEKRKRKGKVRTEKRKKKLISF